MAHHFKEILGEFLLYDYIDDEEIDTLPSPEQVEEMHTNESQLNYDSASKKNFIET